MTVTATYFDETGQQSGSEYSQYIQSLQPVVLPSQHLLFAAAACAAGELQLPAYNTTPNASEHASLQLGACAFAWLALLHSRHAVASLWLRFGCSHASQHRSIDLEVLTGHAYHSSSGADCVELLKGVFKSCFADKPNVVCFSAMPQERKIDGKFTRWIHPLVLAHASTYHKAQGLTLHDGVVMKPPRHNAELGLAYVGISRVTDIEDLTLLSAVNAEHFTTRPHKRALIEAEYERLRRDHLLLARATLGARKQP